LHFLLSAVSPAKRAGVCRFHQGYGGLSFFSGRSEAQAASSFCVKQIMRNGVKKHLLFEAKQVQMF
jgi:hypothetical protein